MSRNFRFKQFEIEQQVCAMKVSTDGVLLGAWTHLDGSEHRILDIGTGTGLVALMLAQRSERWQPKVDAVEIDPQSAAEAAQNAARSPWAARVEVTTADVTCFDAAPYDLIVSNPPYYDSSLLSPDGLRTTARHTVALTFDRLFASVGRLLADRGRFALIVPTDIFPKMVVSASAVGLFVVRETAVSTRTGMAPKRTLAEFARRAARVEKNTFSVHDEGGGYTDSYCRLTADFYLDF
ncbi:MAG: methyltransferase [Tidjanibacter sp.]|nr:methyltransferase [Tidjanibacter sp.]